MSRKLCRQCEEKEAQFCIDCCDTKNIKIADMIKSDLEALVRPNLAMEIIGTMQINTEDWNKYWKKW